MLTDNKDPIILQYYPNKALTDIVVCMASLSELEIAVGHQPFSNQFQDLANQN